MFPTIASRFRPSVVARSLLCLAVVATMFAINGGSGPSRVLAVRQIGDQTPPPSGTLSKDDWINLVLDRAGGFVDDSKLRQCLQDGYDKAPDRNALAKGCYVALTFQPDGDLDALEQLALIADIPAAKAQQAAAIAREAQTVLAGLKARGASDDQIAAISGPLTACINTWGWMAGYDSDSDVLSDDELLVWCYQDVPDYASLDDTLPKTPTIQTPKVKAVGCPGAGADLTVGVAFSCTAVVDGPTTTLGWAMDGGSGNDLTGLTFSVTLPDNAGHTIEFIACNQDTDHCDNNTQTVSASLQAPTIDGLSCPDHADAGQAISCTTTSITPTDAKTTYSWTASGGSAAGGSSSSASITFTAGGSQQVTLHVCNGSHCTDASVPVAVNAAPSIASLNCTPTSGPAPLNVACTVTVNGASASTTKSWATSGGTTNAGSGDSFSTTFNSSGTFAINFTACNGSLCVMADPASVTVNELKAPNLGPLNCSPSFPNTGDAIVCSPSVDPSTPVTSYAWSAPGGNPAVGGASSFQTIFSQSGTQTITLTACNGPTACTTKTVPIVVGNNAPLQVAGSISVHESDVDCGFSGMPATSGTISFTVTYGAAGAPATITGSISGGGSGSRTVHCSGGSASESWQESYSGSFSGTVDPQSGAILSATGMVTGSGFAGFSNCKDTGGNSAPCPHVNSNWSFPLHILGTINGGSIAIDSGCSTAGTWSAR